MKSKVTKLLASLGLLLGLSTLLPGPALAKGLRYLSPNLVVAKAGNPVRLSEHFMSTEFEDGVSEYVVIDMRLVRLLERIRDAAGCKIIVTSGFRSKTKQAELLAKGYEATESFSTHQVGSAADIKSGCGHSGAELKEIAVSVGAKAVGEARAWVHVDLRNDKQREWNYAGPR